MWDFAIEGMRAITALTVGFVLTGLLVVRLLLLGMRTMPSLGIQSAAAVIISLVLLFHIVFWSAVISIPLTARTIWPIVILLLITLTIANALKKRRSFEPPAEIDPTPIGGSQICRWILTAIVVLVGVALLVRTMLWPLAGPDTSVRWDHLATRMLKYQGMDFYPPVTSEDFRRYFYVDGIPPLVSIAYWWIYGSVGRYVPALTGVLLAIQYAAIIAFVYGIGRMLHSSRAGLYAIAGLASSVLFTWSIAIGQETGMTALSMAAMIYFILESQSQNVENNSWRWMILAGLAVGLGALAREYGWAFVGIGILALIWRRMEPRAILIFLGTALLTAGPWYVRNFIRTGNPLYNASLPGFPVNQVHAGIMQSYRDAMGVSTWTLTDWATMSWFFFKDAAIASTFGVLAAILLVRWLGFMLIAVLVVVGLWLWSVGYTSGGALYSMRVLSPAVVVLSVLAGILIAKLTPTRAAQYAFTATLAIAGAWGLIVMAFHPVVVDQTTLRNWTSIIVSQRPPDSDWPQQLLDKLPMGTGVLTDVPYVAAALADQPCAVIPVWSPEVQFLLDDSIPPHRARRQLLQLGVRHVVAQNQINLRYLVKTMRLYREDSSSWRLVHEFPGTAWVLELPPPQEPPSSN